METVDSVGHGMSARHFLYVVHTFICWFVHSSMVYTVAGDNQLCLEPINVGVGVFISGGQNL